MQKIKEVAWHAKTEKDIFKELKTSEKGISQEEADKRLKKYGKNIIKKTNKLQPLKILLGQFNSFLIYILFAAAIISFLINNKIDSVVIFAVILLNGGIGFFQQYRAEKAIIGLKKLIVSKSRVLRDNVMIEIPSSELVPGDIIVLEPGNKINADARIIEQSNLQTNEAILTGESLPVTKSIKILFEKIALSKKENMLFTGTQIVRGNAKAIVVETGMSTFFGSIAESLQEMEIQLTPMQKRLDKFSKQIGFFILGLVAIVVLLGLTKYFELTTMFMTAVALAVSAIPEGLPAVLAIAFSISSVIMSKNKVIIRRLPAVETLGSVTVICSDKTGTITEEEMKIQEIFADNKFYSKKEKKLFLGKKEINIQNNLMILSLLKTSILCNNARHEIGEKDYEFLGDPTETSLVHNALDFGLNKKLLTEEEISIKKFEFDSKRKMMSVVRRVNDKHMMYSKGAIEKILDLCTEELIEGKSKKLTLERKKQLRDYSKKMEQKALRVLAFASREFNSKSNNFKEENLTFLGFAGMIDPPRSEVKDAIRQCKNAGIDIKIITGDSEITAKAIAEQIGITGRLITETELEKMSDGELLSSIKKISIFARTTPHQKLRIAKILQQKGEVIAMTGDGINDVLALKSADIGVAMGKRGTDVARDVSDIVLIDDNFSSIVQGVRQGRKTYDNIKKFTKYFLAVNFSSIFLILFAMVLGMLYGAEKYILPLLPLQILWMNLITDSLPALALVFEKQEDVMKTKPRKEKSLLSGTWKFIILAGIFALIMEFLIYLIGIQKGFASEKIWSIVLTTAILYELFFVYVCRSEKPILKIGFFSNKWLNYAILISLIIHLVLIYTPLGNIFQITSLTIKDWLLIVPFSLSGLIVFEIGKYFRHKRRKK